MLLRAAGDMTRLRLLSLLTEAELTVSELRQILAQSQPRVSRHLKLLCDAGLLERSKEGSWVFYRAATRDLPGQFCNVLSMLSDRTAPLLEADFGRLAEVRAKRAAEAAFYFRANAAQWERIRSLHAPDDEVEGTIVRLCAEHPVESLLDAGTGTGRMLELLGPRVKRAIGVDISPEMLAIAREKLSRSHLQHCQVRLADAYRLPFANGSDIQGFDAVLFHQVLHYMDDPQAAVVEASRVMKPSGHLLIVDFAPHELEFLRTEYAHRRLGFSDREIEAWFDAAGLKPNAGEAIAPRRGEEKLTVKIWVAKRKRISGTAVAA